MRLSLYTRRRRARGEIDFRRRALEAERAIRPPFRLIFISPLNAGAACCSEYTALSAAKLSLDSIPPGWCALITFVFQPGAPREQETHAAEQKLQRQTSPRGRVRSGSRKRGCRESDGKRKFRGIGTRARFSRNRRRARGCGLYHVRHANFFTLIKHRQKI
jgi:hypothetical protein